MRTTKTELEADSGLTGIDEKTVDPEELWLDLDVPPEELIELDPLDITPNMVEQAERPEEADWTLRHIRPRRFSLRMEELQRKLMRGYLQKVKAEREASAKEKAADAFPEWLD